MRGSEGACCRQCAGCVPQTLLDSSTTQAQAVTVRQVERRLGQIAKVLQHVGADRGHLNTIALQKPNFNIVSNKMGWAG